MSEMLAEPRDADRRADVRFPCSEDGFGVDNSCRPVGAERAEAWSASVRDLSTSGIGLFLNRRFEPGALLVVELHDLDRAAARRTLLVRVVRVQKEERNWILGCEFIHRISEQELLAMM